MTQKLYQRLKLLSNDEKEAFLIELLQSIEESEKHGNPDLVRLCIESWEATAELHDLPEVKEKVWCRYEKLKNAGVIHG